MPQEVTVTSETEIALKPLLQAAIQTEVHMLELELNRTRRLLHGFEQEHGMTTAEFLRRRESGELGRSVSFIEWSIQIKAVKRLEAQRQALSNARLN